MIVAAFFSVVSLRSPSIGSTMVMLCPRMVMLGPDDAVSYYDGNIVVQSLEVGVHRCENFGQYQYPV